MSLFGLSPSPRGAERQGDKAGDPKDRNKFRGLLFPMSGKEEENPKVNMSGSAPVSNPVWQQRRANKGTSLRNNEKRLQIKD